MSTTSADLEILCLRHGETRYTGVFPDITPEGDAKARLLTRGPVASWIRKHNIALSELAVISSPIPRAHGTATTVANELGYTKSVVLEEKLGPLHWRDYDRALAACRGLAGKGYINYETEPVFANPEIFETPTEVRDRWYAYFAEFISMAIRTGGPKFAIFVSHYEVLSNLVHDLFGIVASEATALQYVEPIALSVTRSELCPSVVYLTGRFRGEYSAVSAFDVTTRTFHICA